MSKPSPHFQSPTNAPPVLIGSHRLALGDLVAYAREARPLRLDSDPAFRARIAAGAAQVMRRLEEGEIIYGVTTGYGDNCEVKVPPEAMADLPLHLTRYHGCGMGRDFPPQAVRSILAARLNSLARGFSGVRWELLEQVAALIEHELLPRIPEEGSVGASGDLTPLSYLAAVLVGEREANYRDRLMPAAEALAAAGLRPLRLARKEGLALMNGTAVMTGLACLAWDRAEYLTRLAARLSALASAALQGRRGHFSPRLFAAKPHAGQNQVANWIYEDLAPSDDESRRLQDRYSIRCAPHVIGVLRDALGWMAKDIENELNSANDNPLIDPDTGELLHGGHFYGGHIGFAMDALKTAVASVADLLDRQLALLVDTRYNNGLPQNLSAAPAGKGMLHHGFKAVQIAVSAWTAEALKLTMPATSFSRSTECHNQDKVSMGTIAARDALRVLELTEQVAAAQLLACRQAIALRERDPGAAVRPLMPAAQDFVGALAAAFPLLEADRALESDLRAMLAAIQDQRWKLY
jgi:histidine ammonia-lyase